MTSTLRKADAKAAIGLLGLRNILAMLKILDHSTPIVAIGGLNCENVPHVLDTFVSKVDGSQDPNHTVTVAGVAVVSAIMGAPDPTSAAKCLARMIQKRDRTFDPRNRLDVAEFAPALISRVRSEKPLSHNMTNFVVQNFAANVALAM